MFLVSRVRHHTQVFIRHCIFIMFCRTNYCYSPYLCKMNIDLTSKSNWKGNYESSEYHYRKKFTVKHIWSNIFVLCDSILICSWYFVLIEESMRKCVQTNSLHKCRMECKRYRKSGFIWQNRKICSELIWHKFWYLLFLRSA